MKEDYSVAIMRLVANGATSKEIAETLGISNYEVLKTVPKANMNNKS